MGYRLRRRLRARLARGLSTGMCDRLRRRLGAGMSQGLAGGLRAGLARRLSTGTRHRLRGGLRTGLAGGQCRGGPGGACGGLRFGVRSFLKVRVERGPLCVPGEGEQSGGLEGHAVDAIRGVRMLQHVDLGDLTGEGASELNVVSDRWRQVVEEREHRGWVPIGNE